jgi:hypothetical protein
VPDEFWLQLPTGKHQRAIGPLVDFRAMPRALAGPDPWATRFPIQGGQKSPVASCTGNWRNAAESMQSCERSASEGIAGCGLQKVLHDSCGRGNLARFQKTGFADFHMPPLKVSFPLMSYRFG